MYVNKLSHNVQFYDLCYIIYNAVCSSQVMYMSTPYNLGFTLKMYLVWQVLVYEFYSEFVSSISSELPLVPHG